MKLNIKLSTGTSKLLIDVIEELNKMKKGDLDNEKGRLNRLIDELDEKLEPSEEKDQIIDFLRKSIEEDEFISLDEDPIIIDNQKLINITTNKMAKKDLIMQELAEVKSILENKTYSQLLEKYHARLFSDIEGLTEEEGLAKEDIEDIKGKLDEIATQLEEVTDQQVVEVSDEPATEEPATEQPAEPTTPAEEPATEEPATAEPAAEPATPEAPTEGQPTEEPASTEQPADDKDAETLAKIENLDADLDELKSTVESKDFSKTTAKIAARLYSRCYDEIEKLDEDLVDNLEELKDMMDNIASKIEEVANGEEAPAETPAEEPAKGETKEESGKKYGLFIDGVLTATGTMQEMADAKAELDSEVKERAEVTEFSDGDCYEIFDKATGRATADHGTYDEMSDRLREHEDSSAYGIRKCTKCNTEGAPETPAEPQTPTEPATPAAPETPAEEELPTNLMLGVEEEPIALTQEPTEEPVVEVEPLEFITGSEEIIDSAAATPIEEKEEGPMTFDSNLMLEETETGSAEGTEEEFTNDLELEGEPTPIDDMLD